MVLRFGQLKVTIAICFILTVLSNLIKIKTDLKSAGLSAGVF